MIMKQIEYLKSRGHWVQAVFRSGDPNSRIMPNWANIKVDSERLLNPHQSIVSCFEDADIVLIG